MDTIPALLSCVFVLFSAHVIHIFFFSPLRHLPGPKFAALSDLWMLRQVLGGRGSFSIDECLRKYGNIVRIGPKSVAVRRPEDFKEIYISHKYRKDQNMAKLRIKDIENVISATDPEVHGRLRKLTNPLFTSERVKLLELPLRATLENLFSHLDKSSQTKVPADLWKLYRMFAFDFLGEAAFSKSFGALKRGEYVSFMDDMDKFFIILAVKTGLPMFLYRLVRRIPIPAWQDIIGAEDRLMQFAHDFLDKHVASGQPGRADMLAHLHSAVDPSTGQPLSEESITSTVIIFMLAGTDTTSTSLTWITWGLTHHPEVYNKLRKELEAAIPDTNILPDYPVLRRLPYLNAVIKEGLRRWPPPSLYLPRVVPPGGAVHQGYFIPEGTSIGCTPYATHRNDDFFPDPEKFDPERWLEEVDGVMKLRNDPGIMSSYMAWSSGVRSCQGQPVAELELYGIIASIVRRYKFYPAPETNDESMKETEMLLLQPKSRALKLIFEADA